MTLAKIHALKASLSWSVYSQRSSQVYIKYDFKTCMFIYEGTISKLRRSANPDTKAKVSLKKVFWFLGHPRDQSHPFQIFFLRNLPKVNETKNINKINLGDLLTRLHVTSWFWWQLRQGFRLIFSVIILTDRQIL